MVVLRISCRASKELTTGRKSFPSGRKYISNTNFQGREARCQIFGLRGNAQLHEHGRARNGIPSTDQSIVRFRPAARSDELSR